MSSQELRKSYTPSYFSLEDIIASHLRIPCKTEVTINKFGFLDPSQECPDLPKGTEIELPLWVATPMSSSKGNYVSIKMPKYYNEKFREVLKADPTVVDLNKLGPQFYQTGLQLCTLPSDETRQVAELLPEILQKRVIAMMDGYALSRDTKSTDQSANGTSGANLRFHHMDPLEIKLFKDSRHSYEDLEFWLRQ